MALVRACVQNRLPLIVILGATGTGKTKLSIELAQKYRTEVISADSMQIYKGLDIITAKATREERSMVPHHFLDILEPHQTYTVVDFRNSAVKLIDELMAKSKIPIIVGGTNYYIESLLWKVLVEDIEHSDKLVSERTAGPHCESEAKYEDRKGTKRKLDLCDSLEEDLTDTKSLSSEHFHEKLKQLDPDMAERLHPNNKRKILRSLEVLMKTGRRHSELLLEQRSQEGGCMLGGPLRYPTAIVLWLHCEQNVHDQRLSDRVDSMMKEGLVRELTDFHDTYNKHRIVDGESANYTNGIFQSIGLKEFHEYLMLSEDKRQTDEGQKLFNASLENLKIATRRYARRQIKTVKNRLLGYPDRQVPLIYKLDTTDVSEWKNNVTNKAFHIIDSAIKREECSEVPESFSISSSYKDGASAHVTHTCETCNRVFIGDFQYKTHMASKKHKRVMKKLKYKEKIENSRVQEDGSSF